MNFVESVFAVDQNGGMGLNGVLPWPKNKEDMAFFFQITKNSTLIMGRKTWESPDMMRPLPKRKHVILTNHPEKYSEKYSNLAEHVTFLNESDPIKVIEHNQSTFGKEGYARQIVIGGPDILMMFLPLTKRSYITFDKGSYYSDVKIDLPSYLHSFKPTSQFNLNEHSFVMEYINETIS
jgi:dihydrofolate reductase